MPKLAKALGALEVSRLKGRGDGQYAVGSPAGLMLKVDGDSQSWVLRTMISGKRHSIGLGAYPGVPLADARRKAQEARDVIRSGGDPLRDRAAAKAAAKAASAHAVTFETAARKFIESSRPGWKNVKHGDQWASTLSTWAFPILGNLLVQDIQTAHILQVLRQPVGSEGQFWTARAETASRVRQRMEAVIAAADATAGRERLNPARLKIVEQVLPKASKVKKVTHHPALPWQRVPTLMGDLATRDGVAARALAWTVLTAARSGEVRGMVWGELDLGSRMWTVPPERMKADKTHRVPLTDAMLSVLGEPGEPQELVFPAPHGGQLSDTAIKAVLKRMDIVDCTVHGFRSSFRDWAGEATHHPREVIEHALAHKLGDQAERAYARGDLLAKRAVLMEDWSNYCSQGPKPSAVLPLKKTLAS